MPKAKSRTKGGTKKIGKVPSNTRVTKDGWTIIESDDHLALVITDAHVKAAKCGDPAKCVVAQALHAHYGAMADGFEIGTNISKVYSEASKRIVRFATSAPLARSIKVFDETGQWHLPPGTYYLRPLPKSYRREARWLAKRDNRDNPGVQSTFKGTKKAPTRHAPNICQMMKRAA